MEKVDTMKEQIGNISREMETANENHKEMLEITSNVTEMKTAFDGLISSMTFGPTKKSAITIMHQFPKP